MNSNDLYEENRFIQTWMGKDFHLYGNDPGEIDIRDIARALSHTGRFSGHTSRMYSVAEHSLLVMDMVMKNTIDTEVWQLALMHDTPEAYLADIATPFKPALANFVELEDRVWARIADKFNVKEWGWSMVKHWDRIACFAESMVLQPRATHTKWPGYEQYGVAARFWLTNNTIQHYHPAKAEEAFLSAFRLLFSKSIQEKAL